ncbi:MAG: family 16 glycoside hydrolase [Fimbriimonadaceae bacterium]
MLAPLLALALTAQEPPRDIWVFRSVLDGRARMATANLGKDIWVAYDAANCGMYKIWIGGVKLDGSVYTDEHGPQPTAVGETAWKGPADKQVWNLNWNGKNIKPRFRGYRVDLAPRSYGNYRPAFTKSDLVFNFEFELGNGKSAFVREQVLSPNPEHVIRNFMVEGLPETAKLSLECGPHTAAATILGAQFGSTFELKNGVTQISLRLPPADLAEADIASADLEDIQEPQPLENGLALRVYWVGEPMERLPLLVGGQSPNFSTVIPKVDLSTKEDFGGFDENLFADLTGFVKISEPGAYTLRLTSDDGSRMFLDEKLLIDNDGLHGSEGKEAKVSLSAGNHPIKIEYFEGQADNVLKLEWKRPGAADFEIVPTAALLSPKGEVKVTAPGKKQVQSAARRERPGDGLPLVGVHPSFNLATVRPESFRPRVGGIDFWSDGRMVICNWEPDGGVYELSGVTAKDPNNVKVKRVAFGLAEPLGLKIVNNEIYVLQKQELTKLIDHNRDGITDEYYCVANGWGVTPNFHEFAFGLAFQNGHFYGNLATAINPGGSSTQPQNPDRGKTIEIDMDGTFRYVASGLRTPNGVGIGPNGEILLSDNQGDWLPASKIMVLKKGAFYGSHSVDPVGTRGWKETPPLVWLPQGEIGNSPSNIVGITSGPFKGQLFHGDVTHGGVKRVFYEKVNGQLQGCVFRFTQGLEAGVNRIMWGPDGALYVGGIGSTGNWGQEGKERFGLQRLTYNERPTFEMLAVRAYGNGMEIELTLPLAKEIGLDPADYRLRKWRYVPTEQYGGPKVDEEELTIDSVSVSPNRRKIFLETKGLKAGHVVYVKLGHGFHSDSLMPVWSTEGWYTLNQLPGKKHPVSPHRRLVNVLSNAENSEGFKLLFNGKDFQGYKGFRSPAVPPAWKIVDGEIAVIPELGGGDLTTIEQYGDFELRLEWKASLGANSGIMYRASETQEYAYLTGPEMQVLDDERHGDGRSKLTSAGSLYALVARSWDMARPAGAWNEVRIVCKGNHIEHWLNGAKVVSIDIGSPEWKRAVTESKFQRRADYGTFAKGHIVLQDHGDRVWYRSIRIKPL